MNKYFAVTKSDARPSHLHETRLGETKTIVGIKKSTVAELLLYQNPYLTHQQPISKEENDIFWSRKT